MFSTKKLYREHFILNISRNFKLMPTVKIPKNVRIVCLENMISYPREVSINKILNSNSNLFCPHVESIEDARIQYSSPLFLTASEVSVATSLVLLYVRMEYRTLCCLKYCK
jgi:hypothetical protein